jgi:hypothetical protein
MTLRSLFRTTKHRWPACRWLVLRDDSHELLEERIRIDWVDTWGTTK